MQRILRNILFCLFYACAAHAQLLGTAFTYQGALKENNALASGQYDFEFVLFSAANGGSQLTAPLARNGVAVDAGVFSVQLDFGDQFTGVARFLEIHARQSGSNQFTVLSPRQQVMPTQTAITLRSTGLALIAYNDNISTKLLDCADVACSAGTVHVLDQGAGNVEDYEISIARRADDRPVIAYASHDGGVRLILCATLACQ